jgi:hypothetical protein
MLFRWIRQSRRPLVTAEEGRVNEAPTPGLPNPQTGAARRRSIDRNFSER